MKLILSPKDNVGKMVLEDVTAFALEGATLLVVFKSGRTRNYPLQHLWYYESHVKYHKTKPLVEDEPVVAVPRVIPVEDEEEELPRHVKPKKKFAKNDW